jgi:hypothetical protein
LLEKVKLHEAEKITETKNNLYMIGYNLYWNYYYLNIANTKLNVDFSHLPWIKKQVNMRRKYSRHHIGLGKLAIMDIKLQFI